MIETDFTTTTVGNKSERSLTDLKNNSMLCLKDSFMKNDVIIEKMWNNYH